MTNRDKNNRPQKPQLFSVFIWPEQTDDAEISWRGQLKRLENGTVHYFRDWNELIEQIQTELNQSTKNNG